MVDSDNCYALVSFKPDKSSSKLWLMVSSFPIYLPVDSANIGNMNWSIVVIGAIIIFPGIYWVTHARHVYIKESNSTLESSHQVIEGIPPVLNVLPHAGTSVKI